MRTPFLIGMGLPWDGALHLFDFRTTGFARSGARLALLYDASFDFSVHAENTHAGVASRS